MIRCLIFVLLFTGFFSADCYAEITPSGFQPSPPDTLQIGDLIFSDFFSPNGDGINDTFIILNAEKYLGNNIKIIDRWGETVFTAAPYLNDWNGTCITKTIGVNQLTEGVYFYQFDTGVGSIATGKVTLKR